MNKKFNNLKMKIEELPKVISVNLLGGKKKALQGNWLK